MPSSRILTTALSLVAVIGTSAALITPALASSARTAPAAVTAVSGTGSYSSWWRAQKAAKFTLKKPTITYGLNRTGKIIVDQCIVTGHLKDKVVDASYGNLAKKAFSLEQDNASGPCAAGNQGSYLGKYTVKGTTARLYGFCGTNTPFSCSSTNIELWLIWQKGKYYYTAASHDELRKRLVHFARTLKSE